MPGAEGSISEYARIAGEIRGKIERGIYAPGAPVPSRQEIIERWNVSDTTARNVINQLAAEGLVTSRRGRGTFVRKRPTRTPVPPRLYQVGAGPTPDESFHHVLSVTVAEEEPPERIATELGVKPGETVVVRHAVLANAEDEQPVLLRTSYLPTDLAAGSPLASDPPLTTDWITILQQAAGREVDSVTEHTRVRSATHTEARQLNLNDNAPIVITHAVTYAGPDQPLEHTRYAWPAHAVETLDFYSTHP